MEVSPGKRRHSPSSFSDLVESLYSLAGEIAAMKPLRFPLRNVSLSAIRKASLISAVFSDVAVKSPSNSSATLSLDETLIALQRLRALLTENEKASSLWSLVKSVSISDELRELSAEISTLLDIFPAKDLGFFESDDVAEVLSLARKRETTTTNVDPGGEKLRREATEIMEGIEKEIAPSSEKLRSVFQRIGVCDSSSCRDEIEKLRFLQREDEIEMMMGLVQYAKVVLFGASSSSPASYESEKKVLRRRASEASVAVPVDFLCPITLEMMKDPVVVSTGQTYDLEAIRQWVNAGHRTCPKSGQPLSHTEFIPNLSLRNLVSSWCRANRVVFFAEKDGEEGGERVITAAIGATRLTAAVLVKRLEKVNVDSDIAGGILYEIRTMSKTNSESRRCMAALGAVPLIVRHLSSCTSVDQETKVNAVTALLNLSLLRSNKDLIMETLGAVEGILSVLKDETAAWEARGNAAAAIFSLSSSESGSHNQNHHRKQLGKAAGLTKGLVEVVRRGPSTAKKDALAAVASLAGDRETCFRLVEAGAVEACADVAATASANEEGVGEEAVLAVEAVVKRGGLLAVAAAFATVKKLAKAMMTGGGLGERGRESAAAVLVALCRKGGAEMVAELVSVEGIERAIWNLMETSTPRGRRKAAGLMRLLRRWAAVNLDGGAQHHHHGHDNNYYGNAHNIDRDVNLVI